MDQGQPSVAAAMRELDEAPSTAASEVKDSPAEQSPTSPDVDLTSRETRAGTSSEERQPAPVSESDAASGQAEPADPAEASRESRPAGRASNDPRELRKRAAKQTQA